MKKLNLVGERFSHLTVIGAAPGDGVQSFWYCKCDCGNTIVRAGGDLRKNRNKYQACGCYIGSNKRLNRRLYEVWKGIRARCNNPNHTSYNNYGGRGIAVCGRWDDFKLFLADVESGYKPGLHLDRIDNNGNYEPSNCRWVTQKENGRKTRQCKLNPELAKIIYSSPEEASFLAKAFNVTKTTIRNIKQQKTWA
jgi:hypothetical protein